MIRILLSVMLTLSVVAFSAGCAGKALDASRAGSISESFAAVVQNVEAVNIKGDGQLTSVLGMILGGVVGNQIGDGAGQGLATVGGAMVGAVVGEDADVDNAQRITVRLDSGKTITTILRLDANNPNRYQAGDHVTLFITNGRVTEIR